MLSRGISLGALLAIASCSFFAVTAQASHVGCGDVIVADTRLDSDLLDCSGDGVVIGADGVTLELAGHTIDGVPGNYFAAGVDNTGGHDDVTIQDGAVQDFGQGVAGVGAERFVVRNMTLLALTSGTAGVFLADGSNHGLVERNRIQGQPDGGEGVRISESDDNVVRRNSIAQEGWGIGVGGGADRNLVERNDVTGSRFFGILILQLSNDNVVRRNDTSGNAEDGIHVEHNTSGTLVEQNRAGSNGDDGIQIGTVVGPAVATTLSHNSADGNGDLGIEAYPGVIDGGHNRARANGNPAQCTGVTC